MSLLKYLKLKTVALEICSSTYTCMENIELCFLDMKNTRSERNNPVIRFDIESVGRAVYGIATISE